MRTTTKFTVSTTVPDSDLPVNARPKTPEERVWTPINVNGEVIRLRTLGRALQFLEDHRATRRANGAGVLCYRVDRVTS